VSPALPTRSFQRYLVVLAGAVLLLAGGCGRAAAPRGVAGPPRADLAAAEHPPSSAFPAARGRTLAQVARGAKAGPQVGLASGTFVPGRQRVAFALIGTDGKPVYPASAVYIASGLNRPAEGPFLAPAESVGVPPAFRSTNPDSADIAAVFATQVPLPRAGRYVALVLSQMGGRLVGGTALISVRASASIPGPGDRAPAVVTDTRATVHGDERLLTTRVPPEDMSRVSFKDVLGHKPVVLLFSTPALCQSRVCGPVTDIAVQLQHEFGRRAEFIHQEVYAKNQVSKGLRAPLRAFHLQSEPWIFTFDRSGRVAARLEGAVGVDEFRAAVQRALR